MAVMTVATVCPVLRLISSIIPISGTQHSVRLKARLHLSSRSRRLSTPLPLPFFTHTQRISTLFSLSASTTRRLLRRTQQCRLTSLPRASLSSRAAEMKISAADRDAYRENGVICLRNVFSEEWLELLRKSTEEALRKGNPDMEELSAAFLEAAASRDQESGENKPVPGRFCSEMDCSRKHPGFARFVLESPAAEVAASVMGAAECNFFYDILFVKEPNTVERTVWHQDAPYWAIDGEQVCSIWLPLDPIPRDNCLEFIAGSHRWPVFAPFFFATGELYPEYRDGSKLPTLPPIQEMITTDGEKRWVEYEGRKHEVLSWELAAGDCLVFQRRVVHGAPPNQHAALRRRAFSTRWAGEDATFAPDFDAEGRQRKGYPNFECPELAAGDRIGRYSSAFPLLYCGEGGEAEELDRVRGEIARVKAEEAEEAGAGAGAGAGVKEFGGLSRLLQPGGAGGEYARIRQDTAEKYSANGKAGAGSFQH